MEADFREGRLERDRQSGKVDHRTIERGGPTNDSRLDEESDQLAEERRRVRPSGIRSLCTASSTSRASAAVRWAAA